MSACRGRWPEPEGRRYVRLVLALGTGEPCDGAEDDDEDDADEEAPTVGARVALVVGFMSVQLEGERYPFAIFTDAEGWRWWLESGIGALG